MGKLYPFRTEYICKYNHEENHTFTLFLLSGCPANEATTDEAALTPQKIAKAEGYKDAMKELKKLTTFQDKADRGAKPKGFSEPWAVKVLSQLACICTSFDHYL